MKIFLKPKIYVKVTLIVMVLFFGIYFTLLSGSPIKAKIVSINIDRVDELNMDKNEWMHRFGLNAKQAKDLLQHSERYRFIQYRCELNNTSKFVGIFGFAYQPTFSEEMKKRVLWTQKNPFSYDFPPKKEKEETIQVLIKLKKDDDLNQVIELAKKDRFIIHGNKSISSDNPLDGISIGSFSVEMKYEETQ